MHSARWRTVISLALLTGCAGSAAVQANEHLPVRNVVLYRSGVGYFERLGRFTGSTLQFRVKPHEVGDFLASLTTVEHTSGGVRSVSFEVPTPKPAPASPDGEPAEPAPESETPVEVTLAFGGDGEHDLRVAYVVGAPVWRPSYRIVFDAALADKALLQAWAVVQNGSGEDWRDIRLALTTGAPISFRSDLGTPIVPERPLVSDTGEVVQSVPTGETVVAQAAPKPASPAPLALEEWEAEADQSRELAAEAGAPRAKKEHSRRSRVADEAAAGGGFGAPSMSLPQLEQSVRAQATAAAVTETVTRYDLSDPVTVPNGGATMVALVSTRVPGEQAHLFAPDPGVGLSHQHPFSVVRLVNASGAVLEKGPISVMANGAFLGQGLLDTFPRDAQAFVPFALDKSVVVEPSEAWGDEQGSLVRVQRGVVTVQRFSQRTTRYKIRNGGAAAIKVYLRHARWTSAELVAPPAGSELTPDKALVPARVEPHASAELALVERTPVELSLSIMDARAAEAIGLWLSGPAASDPVGAELKAALALRSELTALDDQIALAEREQAEVNAGASEARKNLKAIEKVARAKDLKDKLYERLKQLDARNATLITQLITSRTRRAELEVRLQEALAAVSLTPAKT